MSSAALVVDASITLAWALPDESSAYAQEVLREVERTAARVPSLWTTEVLNGALMAERRRRCLPEDVDELLAALESLHRRRRIMIIDVRPSLAFTSGAALARGQKLTAYDAAYLHVAMNEGLPLATTDRELIAAAKRLGVGIWKPPR